MKNSKGISKKESVYRYISERCAEGMPPSVREICNHAGIKSTSSAYKYIEELVDDGVLIKDEGKNRNIRPASGSAVQIPVLGTITAGQPILATEQIEGYVSFARKGIPASDLFALRVKGESMIKAGIHSGDLAILRRTDYVSNGDIVAALVGEEATVKRFFKENGRYRLQPENDSMEPILIEDVHIIGKVIALVREYE